MKQKRKMEPTEIRLYLTGVWMERPSLDPTINKIRKRMIEAWMRIDNRFRNIVQFYKLRGSVPQTIALKSVVERSQKEALT